MKRIIKSIVRPFWWATAPVRRPLVRKFEAMLTRTVAPLIDQRIDPFAAQTAQTLGRIEPHVLAARAVSESTSAEANLLMDSLIREITRLQLQVEELRDRLERVADTPGFGLTLVGDGVEANTERNQALVG